MKLNSPLTAVAFSATAALGTVGYSVATVDSTKNTTYAKAAQALSAYNESSELPDIIVEIVGKCNGDPIKENLEVLTFAGRLNAYTNELAKVDTKRAQALVWQLDTFRGTAVKLYGVSESRHKEILKKEVYVSLIDVLAVLDVSSIEQLDKVIQLGPKAEESWREELDAWREVVQTKNPPNADELLEAISDQWESRFDGDTPEKQAIVDRFLTLSQQAGITREEVLGYLASKKQTFKSSV